VYKSLLVVVIVLISGFAGYQYSELNAAKRIVDLNKTIYDLGVVIQTETNVAAENNRQLKLANKGRINAIKINDHANKTVKLLQKNLDRVVREMETLRASRIYRVVDVGAVARVYDQTRRECYGLPDAGNTPVVSAQLSEFTGDSIAEVVRYLAGQYCEVATDYNNLYLDTEKLLAR